MKLWQRIGEAGDSAKAQESGATIGSYLSELGFNLDFAPVADVVPEDGNSVLGDRSFGSDPALTGEMVSNFVTGLQGSDVSSCLKHFPGLGKQRRIHMIPGQKLPRHWMK